MDQPDVVASSGLFTRARAGDRRAAADVWDMVYGELYRMARWRVRSLQPGQTLNATVLVHEAYLKLSRGGGFGWDDAGDLYRAAGQAMRGILVDFERRKGRLKRQVGARRVSLSEATAAWDAEDVDLLELDPALDRLQRVSARAFEVVILRFFAGLTAERAAQSLGISVATAEREWTFAKAWLYRELQRQRGGSP